MNLIRHENFTGTRMAPRHLDVLLPPGYGEGDGRYPVLYMHDGQNVFRDEDAGYGVCWGVGQALEGVVASGEAPPAIVVGIWNNGLMRYPEYRPAKPFLALSDRARQVVTAGLGGMPVSDDYLAFIVNEVKPFIDATYRTRPGRDHTTIMGSSMGGLISLYAICEYPEVFGGAGCVSTHWPAVEGVIAPYLVETLPDPATHRLYFDHGTDTLDALYQPTQAMVDAVVMGAGYCRDVNWVTRKFPGTAHDERSWAQRVWIPLRFLLSAARMEP